MNKEIEIRKNLFSLNDTVEILFNDNNKIIKRKGKVIGINIQLDFCEFSEANKVDYIYEIELGKFFTKWVKEKYVFSFDDVDIYDLPTSF
jgi:hypothetical protein